MKRAGGRCNATGVDHAPTVAKLGLLHLWYAATIEEAGKATVRALPCVSPPQWNSRGITLKVVSVPWVIPLVCSYPAST